MLDELRAHDQMTRYGRKRLGDVSRTIRDLRQSLGREPEEEEVAAAMDMDLLSYQKLTETLARGPALGRGGETEPDEVQSAVRDPLNIFEQKQLRGRLVKAIEELPERTRMVLALYYQEECTQAEIGEILGVSESRVCQILGESAARLRARLERDERTTPAKASR
jgi:RNA polymerase sigma factor for flagellar operon FliA